MAVDYTPVGYQRRRAGGVRHFRAGALNRPFRATSHRYDRLTQAVGLGYGWNAPLGLSITHHPIDMTG